MTQPSRKPSVEQWQAQQEYLAAQVAINMREYTRAAWAAFNRLSDGDLNWLLTAAGVVVPTRRGAKLEAALLVWFSGTIPDMEEFKRLNKVYRDLEG